MKETNDVFRTRSLNFEKASPESGLQMCSDVGNHFFELRGIHNQAPVIPNIISLNFILCELVQPAFTMI